MKNNYTLGILVLLFAAMFTFFSPVLHKVYIEYIGATYSPAIVMILFLFVGVFWIFGFILLARADETK